MSTNIITTHNIHPDTFDLIGAPFKILIPGTLTGNQFSLVEATVPAGSSTPLHRHVRGDQAFYVLEGVIEIVADSKSFFFNKGEICLVRRGTPHIEKNSSDSEARFVTIHSPGFFSEFVRLAGVRVNAGTKLPPPSTLTIDEARKIEKVGLEFDTEILTSAESLVKQAKQ